MEGYARLRYGGRLSFLVAAAFVALGCAGSARDGDGAASDSVAPEAAPEAQQPAMAEQPVPAPSLASEGAAEAPGRADPPRQSPSMRYGCIQYIEEPPPNYMSLLLPGEDTVSCLTRTRCAACHTGTASTDCAAGICYYPMDLNDLIERGDIVPGDPNASSLYRTLASGSMPPPGSMLNVSDEDVQDVALFILKMKVPESDTTPNGDLE